MPAAKDTIHAMKTERLPEYAPVPRSSLGPAFDEQGYYVGRVERNLYRITDGTYRSALVTTSDGVVLLDAPPTIGQNIHRVVEIASASGVSDKITHVICSHHDADHVGASFLFNRNVSHIGHEETQRLLLRDDDPARPPTKRRVCALGPRRPWLTPSHACSRPARRCDQ